MRQTPTHHFHTSGSIADEKQCRLDFHRDRKQGCVEKGAGYPIEDRGSGGPNGGDIQHDACNRETPGCERHPSEVACKHEIMVSALSGG